MRKSVQILGTRGIPARHGGFETFAQELALYLEKRGWDVTVYCQSERPRDERSEAQVTFWQGVRCVSIGAPRGVVGTVFFDLLSTLRAARNSGVCLVLGYNTAILILILKCVGRRVLVNMDGIEWKRRKWGTAAKAWLLLNEVAGATLADLLIADHPAIRAHLLKYRKESDIVVIPYGANRPIDSDFNTVQRLGLIPYGYVTQIGRLEPENSILELIQGYSMKPRSFSFVCLGKLDSENAYHRALVEASSDGVKFLGAIYDGQVVGSIRSFSVAHCHGHTVGGTNPSLVEALAAGNAILAHDNQFNRWVAGPEQYYFSNISHIETFFDLIDGRPDEFDQARNAALARWTGQFRWPPILAEYEGFIDKFTAGG